MDPSAILGIIFQAAEIFKLVKTIYQGVRDAPVTIRNLTAEAQCLRICLAALTHQDCLKALQQCDKEQVEDLKDILTGCALNAEEMIVYVRQIQWIVAENYDPKLVKEKLWRRIFRIPAKAKELWAKCDFALTDQQPMRNKLAIPLQSLNIFLVSLTFVRIPRTGSLSHDGNATTAKLPSGWNVVGQYVAFRSAKFDASDLSDFQNESKIIKAANCIIKGHCDASCHPCCSCRPSDNNELDDDSAYIPSGTSSSPKSVRRKSQISSDKMFLVRSKSKQREKPKPSIRRVKREAVPPRFEGDDSDENEHKSAGFFRVPSPAPRRQRMLSPSSAIRSRGRRPSSPSPGFIPFIMDDDPPDRHNATNFSPVSDAVEKDAEQRESTALDQQSIERFKRDGLEAAKQRRREATRRARVELETGVDVTDRTFRNTMDSRDEYRRRQYEELKAREHRLREEMNALEELRARRKHEEDRLLQTETTSLEARNNLREQSRTHDEAERREARRIRAELDDCELDSRIHEVSDDSEDDFNKAEDRPVVQTYMRIRYGLEIYPATEQSIQISKAIIDQDRKSHVPSFTPGVSDFQRSHNIAGLDIHDMSDDDDDDDDEDDDADEDYPDLVDSNPTGLPTGISLNQKILPESSATHRMQQEERRRALFKIYPPDHVLRFGLPYSSIGYDTSRPHIEVETHRLRAERLQLRRQEHEIARRERMLQRREAEVREHQREITRHEGGPSRYEYGPDTSSPSRRRPSRRMHRERMDYHAPYVAEDEDESSLRGYRGGRSPHRARYERSPRRGRDDQIRLWYDDEQPPRENNDEWSVERYRNDHAPRRFTGERSSNRSRLQYDVGSSHRYEIDRYERSASDSGRE